MTEGEVATRLGIEDVVLPGRRRSTSFRVEDAPLFKVDFQGSMRT